MLLMNFMLQLTELLVLWQSLWRIQPELKETQTVTVAAPERAQFGLLVCVLTVCCQLSQNFKPKNSTSTMPSSTNTSCKTEAAFDDLWGQYTASPSELSSLTETGCWRTYQIYQTYQFSSIHPFILFHLALSGHGGMEPMQATISKR